MTYDIEITDFVPDSHTRRTVVSSADEASDAVRAAEALDPCVLLVGRHDGNVSRGDFHVWLNGDRALVRLDAHREWYAMDPDWSKNPAAGDAWFRDSDGASFPAQNAETVSRSQAFEAIHHWLETGEMLPSLRWA